MVSSQPSLQTPVRKESLGFTLRRSQCMPGPYAPCLDDAGVGTLDASASNRPSLVLKAWRVHQVFPLLQGMHLGLELLHIRMLFEQPPHFCSHVCRAMVFEFMQLLIQPVFRQGCASIADQRSNGAEIGGSHDKHRESAPHRLVEHQSSSESILPHL